MIVVRERVFLTGGPGWTGESQEQCTGRCGGRGPAPATGAVEPDGGRAHGGFTVRSRPDDPGRRRRAR